MRFQTSRAVRIIAEIIGIGVIIWLLTATWGNAQQSTEQFTHGQRQEIGRDTAVLKNRIDTLTGPDGQSGVIGQINRHIDNTDQNVAGLNAFMNKILGGLIALGGLQTFNLIVSFITGKHEDRS